MPAELRAGPEYLLAALTRQKIFWFIRGDESFAGSSPLYCERFPAGCSRMPDIPALYLPPPAGTRYGSWSPSQDRLSPGSTGAKLKHPLIPITIAKTIQTIIFFISSILLFPALTMRSSKFLMPHFLMGGNKIYFPIYKPFLGSA
jgi:hypothetical protein